MIEQKYPIVIYDGECNLCDSSVKFILRNERKEELRFTHLKSEEGKKIMNKFKLDKSFDGILFLKDGKLYGKSEAIIEISKYLKYPSQAAKHFNWVPLFLRDGLYDIIAKRRYKWFGKDDCLIPDPRIRERFI